MKWFRGLGGSKEPLAVSMAGVKLGDRVLVIGCGDPPLIAGLGTKTGLTGRTCALDAQDGRAASAAAFAESEGALVEAFTAPWTMLPFDANAFDVAIVRDVLPSLEPPARSACLTEVRRVLRPGGRCMSIDPSPRHGLGGLLKRPDFAATDCAGSISRDFEAQGFRAVRTLAEREGLIFSEGIKGQ